MTSRESKFYKVDPEKLIGKILGNSTTAVNRFASIVHEEFIKANVDGSVTTAFGCPIWALRRMHEDQDQLYISTQELVELFEECEDPGPKVISNIRFVVGTVDYENFYEVESFTDSTEAINACQNFNDTDPVYYYDIRVMFDAKWNKESVKSLGEDE